METVGDAWDGLDLEIPHLGIGVGPNLLQEVVRKRRRDVCQTAGIYGGASADLASNRLSLLFFHPPHHTLTRRLVPTARDLTRTHRA